MKEKKIIIGVMLAAIAIMAVGYAALSARLVINGTANIASTWKVVFTDIQEVSKTSGVTITSTPTASGTTATFNVDLSSPGDKIEYGITVENQGTLDAVIENIRVTETGNEAIIFNVTNIEIGDTLAKKTSTTFNVTIQYNPNVAEQPDNLTNELTVAVDYVQQLGESSGSSGSEAEVIFNKENPTELTFISEEEIDTFQEVRVDENVVDSSNYTVTSGSTIVELKREYLQTLSVGIHTMDIVSTTGSKRTTFEVKSTITETNFVNAILEDNEVYADNVASKYVTGEEGIDFSAISSDTNGKGLYYTSTNTEDSKTTYYFRGAVENNYVKFGTDSNGNELYWRIVRINEDGSVRLIYQGTSATATGAAATIGTRKFNSIYTDNAYVGYMYGTTGASTYSATHANTNDSRIKEAIDYWYETNLKDKYSSYLSDAGFCNDRSVASSSGLWYSSDTALGYGTNRTYYGAYNRLSTNKKPQFACPNADNDLFTTSTSSKGNKALDYPIGLITADEIWYAGGFKASNSSYYLYTGESYWTMSSHAFHGSDARVWYVVGSGVVGYDRVDGVYGVRPAVNLKSTVEITGGDGKIGSEYVIK